MIVTKLMGGLGNQLFQYAAARALSLKYNTNCFIDTSFLDADPKNAYTKRNYELDYFNISATKCPTDVLNKIAKQTSDAFIDKLTRKFGFQKEVTIYNENGHQFNSEFNKLPNDLYLNGFWQSEQYFKKFEEQIRKELTIKEEFLKGTESYTQLIQEQNTVSLHVRRGDYVNLKSANDFHGMCSISYYKKALEYINTLHSNLQVFIFSDDLDWCKTNLSIANKHTYVETQSDIQDLYLMQQCHQHIIANSSFSWWGAWLNNKQSKTVIAPNQWFSDVIINTSDIIPTNWVTL